ncbi:MAG: hypothetical protein EPO51_22530 [Phenylobacterium sp.]|uniref:hypothetical protein n=1 Tax=Phenylobacterium sp. TaxID=1871053 RepID=UPI0011FF0A47|nr:hypothetical protein [Phenylobacterium sp.]TAJ69499.1 MAG: hypothetical protein EPO51_22530 [Phenylobacterium sp.]
MATRFQPRRRPDRFSPARFSPRPVQAPQPIRPPLPPAAVIDAVLRFHDVEVDQGGQRTLLRLSERALREPQVAAALGADARRAANIAILWNERESEIIRVLEGNDARIAA